jgi:putative aldouronate transport system substrate-binding protein
MSPQQITRRSLFAGGAALGLGAVAACSGPQSSPGADGESVDLPTYSPVTGGPQPDLPGNEIVQPGYFASPGVDSLFTSVEGEIGSGGTTSALLLTYGALPPADNTYLPFMEEEVGTTFDLQYVPADSYSQKFATVVAGGDLPDMLAFLTFQLPARYPQLLEAQFADLSDLLAGDAISDYPNLANIPAASWVGARVNGRIRGVPVHRPPFGSILVSRSDIIAELTGAEPAPQSEQDFTDLCAAVTDPRANRYALCGQSGGSTGVDWAYDFMSAMFGVPNGWRLEGGKLTSKYETDEWLRMLAYIKKLNDAGCYHPDTPSLQNAQAKTYIANGTVLLHLDGISALLDTTLPEGTSTSAIVPFSADGGPGTIYQGSSSFSFTALKKADDDRLREQLRILNYLAAPFGSVENFTTTHGREGEHWTRTADGGSELTEAGQAQVTPSSLYRLASGPQVLYSNTPIEAQIRNSHRWQEASQTMLLESPVNGLYSEASSSSGSANDALGGAMTDYVLGRRTLDEVKDAISSWTSSTGDAMRTEYQQALESA